MPSFGKILRAFIEIIRYGWTRTHAWTHGQGWFYNSLWFSTRYQKQNQQKYVPVSAVRTPHSAPGTRGSSPASGSSASGTCARTRSSPASASAATTPCSWPARRCSAPSPVGGKGLNWREVLVLLITMLKNALLFLFFLLLFLAFYFTLLMNRSFSWKGSDKELTFSHPDYIN